MTVTRRSVLVGAAVLVAGYLAYDYLVTSDAERLAAFSKAVTGSVTTERIQAALGYVDVEVEPLFVEGMGVEREFPAGSSAAVRSFAREALASLQGDDLRVLGEAIEVEGDRGFVSLRVVSRLGMGNMKYRLRKHGERWLVSEVRVER